VISTSFRKWEKVLGKTINDSTDKLSLPVSEIMDVLVKFSKKESQPNIEIEIPKTDPTSEFLIVIVFKGPIAALNSKIIMKLEEQKVDEGWILKQLIQNQQREIQTLRTTMMIPRIASFHSPHDVTITTAKWTDVTGLSSCKFHSTGHVKVTLDFSAYGNQHGGIRIVVDKGLPTEKIFGTDSTYGLDWVVAATNVWEKRCIVRVFPILEGDRIFTVQIKAQNEGNSFRIHGGTTQDYHSGC
jgi:hypothetical protein